MKSGHLKCRKFHYTSIALSFLVCVYFFCILEWQIPVHDKMIEGYTLESTKMNALFEIESSRYHEVVRPTTVHKSRKINRVDRGTLDLVPSKDAAIPSCSNCPYVNANPFDPVMMKHFIKRPTLDCSKGLPSVVYTDGDDFLRVNFTKVNQTIIGKMAKCRFALLQLSYENDKKLQRLKWSADFLHEPIKLTPFDEHIFVECYNFENVPVAQTYMSRIIEKPIVELRSNQDFERHLNDNSPLETLNVLVLGIDGVSKQNFIRGMPKTRDFLINELNAKELNKFNKVGENTFPNLIALHTGLHAKELNFDHFKWDVNEYFDVVEPSFVWHKFQKQGYRTYMGFDVTDTMFHNGKKGFKNPTFDYYNKPVSLHLDSNRLARYGGDNCVGQESEPEVLLDYLAQFVSKFNQSTDTNNNTREGTTPYFAYNFFTRLTHDDPNEVGRGDDIYLNFFKQLKYKNVLENTLVIFLSDHGLRFGPSRQTINGMIETTTPFVFFMFPPWFESKYPDVMTNFTTNQDRLTTYFDVHKTLLDVLHFSGKIHNQYDNNDDEISSARAKSLFGVIPVSRTCRDADIPIEFCNLRKFSNIDVKDESKELSKLLVETFLDFIVNVTVEHRDICAELTLQEVKSILMIKSGDSCCENGAKSEHFQVTIETSPGEGVYETVLQYEQSTQNASVVGEIQRLNFYRRQEYCLNIHALKPYCFCRE